MHFPGWEQVLDFMHLLGNLYDAAQCAWPGAGKRAWSLYAKLLTLSWKGKVGEVICYRREGLPITSTLVESLIKQVNQRMKGTEKFWARGGAEAA